MINISIEITKILNKFINFVIIGFEKGGVSLIVNKLSEVMGRKRLKISDVVEKTGLARNTVTELYHGRAKRVDLETLDKLCKALGCPLEDILIYIDEEKTTEG